MIALGGYREMSGRFGLDFYDGGAIQMIDNNKNEKKPHFTKADDRIYLSKNDGSFLSIVGWLLMRGRTFN